MRLVWHDMPLPMHPDAPLAAQAGREAMQQRGAQGFWALHDVLFKDQHKLARTDLDDAARAVGLDMRRWSAALDTAAHAGEVEAESRVADSLSITGTPSFVIVPAGLARGYFVGGAQPYAKFRKLVDRALGEAR